MWLDLITDPAEEDFLAAIIKVYFDESGKLGDSPTTSFCGIVGYGAQWANFDREWLSMLKDAELPYLKMVHAMNWEGPFRDWMKRQKNREDLRDALLVSMAKRACKSIQGIITNPITSADFRKMSSAAQKRFRDPVYMSFESCMRSLAEIYPGQIIHVCYDCSEQYSVCCLEMYHRMRKDSSEYRNLFRSISFSDEEATPGLQLADIVAYCQREMGGSPRPLVSELTSHFHAFRAFNKSFLTEWKGNLGEAFLDSELGANLLQTAQSFAPRE